MDVNKESKQWLRWKSDEKYTRFATSKDYSKEDRDNYFKWELQINIKFTNKLKSIPVNGDKLVQLYQDNPNKFRGSRIDGDSIRSVAIKKAAHIFLVALLCGYHRRTFCDQELPKDIVYCILSIIQFQACEYYVIGRHYNTATDGCEGDEWYYLDDDDAIQSEPEYFKSMRHF